jgi:putative transposase
MPRKPRFFLADIPAHIVQRGHSREPVFFEESDYRAYLTWLGEAARRYDCALHAYVRMTNRVHLLATPGGQTRHQSDDAVHRAALRALYQSHLWHQWQHLAAPAASLRSRHSCVPAHQEGRYKASLIHDEPYLLTCMRYIELNPVRAKMARSPGQYRWSSYRANAQGIEDKINPGQIYFLTLTSAPGRESSVGP